MQPVLRGRTELSLPAPQVSDAELEELVKMGAQAHAHVSVMFHLF